MASTVTPASPHPAPTFVRTCWVGAELRPGQVTEPGVGGGGLSFGRGEIERGVLAMFIDLIDSTDFS